MKYAWKFYSQVETVLTALISFKKEEDGVDRTSNVDLWEKLKLLENMAESTPQLLFAILLLLEAMDKEPNFKLNTSFYVNLSSLIISTLSVWNGLTKYAVYVKQQIGFIKYLQFFFATIVSTF